MKTNEDHYVETAAIIVSAGVVGILIVGIILICVLC